MADEQVQKTSTDTGSVDETATAPVSPSEEQGSSQETPSWWQRLTGRLNRAEATETSAEEQAEPAAEAEPSTITLTTEELNRRVQAETDRREAKRKAEAEAQARKKLRDEDPWQYAEQERQAEQAQSQESQLTQLFSGVGALHDGVTLDPLINTLPEAERARILKLEGAGVGLDGRKLIVDEALKALEKHWKTEGAKDAEQKLRRNPAFRKQVLAEFNGGSGEPEQVPNGTYARTRTSSQEVNDILRKQLGMSTTE